MARELLAAGVGTRRERLASGQVRSVVANSACNYVANNLHESVRIRLTSCGMMCRLVVMEGNVMAFRARPRQDPFTPQGEVLDDDFAVDCIRGKWRIYEYRMEYNSVTGGHLLREKAVRRYDPDAALTEEGNIASFATKADAVAYWQRWLVKARPVR